jgi:HSP20 family protein
MATTLEKRPARVLRNSSPYLNSPLDRFFRNDFIDFWDGDIMLTTVPPVNITEEKNDYIIDMAVPGFKKEDFDINLDGNLLTISCETETETTGNGNGRENGKENGNYSRREYNYSSFSRTITLPDYADSKGITAKYNDGVLNVTVPKKPEAQKMNNQKIKIQ